MNEVVCELEEAVVDAWPAAETEELDGWLLRASGGPTQRGNSVATLAAGSSLTLSARIEQAEAWYRTRGKPPMFQAGPCARPAELDQTLAERGYHVASASVAALAEPTEVAKRTRRCAFETSIVRKPSEAWLDVGVRSSRFAATPEVFLGFLARLGSRCRFVTTRDTQGAPVACCMAITSEDRLGVYAMYTLPHVRKKGAATAMLHALAQCALAEDMRELYLLVEVENVAAHELYARAGFRDLYRYHYRVLAAQVSEPRGPA